MDRLFVPLMKEYWLDFRDNGKSYELRRNRGGYTERHIFPGRKVELRCGYSGASQWGTIGKVVVGSLDEIVRKVGIRKITPRQRTVAGFMESVEGIYGAASDYIAFEVKKG